MGNELTTWFLRRGANVSHRTATTMERTKDCTFAVRLPLMDFVWNLTYRHEKFQRLVDLLIDSTYAGREVVSVTCLEVLW